MAASVKKIALKALKYTGIAFGSILLLMFLLPWLLPGLVTNKVKQWARSSINGELNFSKVQLSFFRHFPSLTVTLHDVVLKGSAPFQADTLIAGNEIGLGVDLGSLFSSKININKVILTDAFINIEVDEKGQANYNIYNTGNKKNKSATNDSSGAALKIEKILIEKSRLIYRDRSIPMHINLRDLDYEGTGDLSKAIFDLQTNMKIGSLDFYYDNTPYFLSKQINAELVTKINTHSLALIFEKNDIVINQLPLQFNGHFEFLSNGYNIDFQLSSKNTPLQDVFSALPPALVNWVKRKKVTGNADISAALKGSYIVEQHKMPDLTMNLKIRNGFILSSKAPAPVKNLYLNLATRLPQLNTDSLQLNIDSIYFNIDKDYFSAALQWQGMKSPTIDGRVRSALDLHKWSQAVGLENMQIAGKIDMDIQSKGRYNPGKKLLPVTTGHFQLTNGALQTAYYPRPVEQININALVTNPQGNFKSLQVDIKPISFLFEGQPFHLQARLADFDNLHYDIVSKGTVPVGKLYQVFAIPGYTVDGLITTDLSLHGNHDDAVAGRYQKLSNTGLLEVKDIRLTTALFPNALHIKNGSFRFNQDKMWFNHFNALYGKNAIVMNGYLSDVISYAMQQGLPLKGRFDLQSDLIVVDDFMAMADSMGTTNATSVNTTAQAGVIMVPPDLAIAVQARVQTVRYGDIDLKNFTGNCVIDKGEVRLKQTAFNIIDAPVSMEALYKPVAVGSALFDYHIKADSFSIQKAYKEIRLFREMATAASKAEGIVSIDYHLNGKLDANMYPVYPSLKGGGVLTLDKIKVKGLKLFSAVSKQTNKDINDPDLSKVTLKTSIANNLIKLERTRMRIAGFRPRIEGEMSFDGKMNLSFRLGLPPFGIIGIPLTITGTQDDPKVQMRRARKGDKLEEVEDVDESEKDEIE